MPGKRRSRRHRHLNPFHVIRDGLSIRPVRDCDHRPHALKGRAMIFNPFAIQPGANVTHRHDRLRDLDARMKSFLAAKRRAGCTQLIDSVETARERVRTELRAGRPRRQPGSVMVQIDEV